MRIWTVHLPPGTASPVRPRNAPILVREGFSWGAFLLALPWFLAHRMWPEAAGYLGLALLLSALVPGWAALPMALALQFLVGAHAGDLRRAALTRRGRPAAHVVAAPDVDAALVRLLDRRPDLARPDLSRPDHSRPVAA